MINAAVVLTILVTSNVLLTNGFGALTLQRGKNNYWFVLLNCVFTFAILVASACIYSAIYNYLLDPYNLEDLGILIIVMLAGAFGFIQLELTKLLSKEMYYYYDATYSYIINLGTTVGMLLCIDVTNSVGLAVVNACLVGVAYALVSILFALIYSRLHCKKVSRMFRPVPITILTISVLAMIIYAISLAV
jgi:Na+-translocating ferredoxin:NAD+ oxidoreductase RnfA subunit